jgi:deaminated glutathione amidase
MRPFTAAAVQVAPAPGPLTPSSVKTNLDICVDHVERCVAATGAELVVLPESATTGYRFPSQCAALQGGGEGTPRRQAWC